MVWFFNSARSAPSALVLEFNIHPSDLRLHLAAGSHVSTGNTATVLFFVIEGFLPYGGGYGEFAMFQICLQGAMSAFLDNTAVLGRQVANIFYIFLSGFTSFIISYPRKTVWGKHQVKKSNRQKKSCPCHERRPLGAHTSAGATSLSCEEDACLLPTIKKCLHEILATTSEDFSCVRAARFLGMFTAAEFFKSILLPLRAWDKSNLAPFILEGKAGNQHNWCLAREHPSCVQGPVCDIWFCLILVNA